MQEISLRENEDFIKLGQLLKKADIALSGTDAKFMIEEGKISVNGVVEYRRGKKITEGDIVSGDGWSYKVIR